MRLPAKPRATHAVAGATALLLIAALLSWGCGDSYQKPTFPTERQNNEQAAEPARPDGDGEESGEDLAAEKEPAEAASQPPQSPVIRAQPTAIPSGRPLTVRLLETVSSKTALPGQHFDAELAAPVTVNGKTVLPKGTPLRGRVVSARASGRLKDPGYLRLTLDSLRTPDGRWVPVKTTSISARGQSHKKRNLTMIGGGTGVGAVIGAIAGGGKGAAIGAAAGAGAGTAGAYATGKQDVTFPVERKLSFSTIGDVQIG